MEDISKYLNQYGYSYYPKDSSGTYRDMIIVDGKGRWRTRFSNIGDVALENGRWIPQYPQPNDKPTRLVIEYKRSY